MIKMLQKAKARRGFTTIELIVVIAIIAVLIAMILPNLNTRNARMQEANSTARDIYSVAQTIFTKYSMFEAPISLELKEASKENSDYIKFYYNASGNYPFTKATLPSDVKTIPQTTDLYLELIVENNEITEVNVANVLETLLKRDASTKNSILGKIFKNDVETRTSLIDGYYYIKVNYTAPASGIGSVKVSYAAFMRTRLPQASGSFGTYRSNHLFFSNNYNLIDGTICGVCAKWEGENTIGLENTYLS